MKVIYFGLIAERAGTASGEFNLEGKSIGEAKEILENNILGLSTIGYQLALNQKIASNSTLINKNDELAALPPFAGG
ncbi:MAG: MoaD/ThiS family protein [Bacteroidia bacterium]|nr:MoaD/ThiS family protein [Bacteroidia bacterium]